MISEYKNLNCSPYNFIAYIKNWIYKILTHINNDKSQEERNERMMHMNGNDMLIKRIQTYMESEVFPEYAILLRGEWGCGKTFFCKQLKKELDGDDVWYISVFGVKDKSEIDEKMFEAAHPLLSSKEGKGMSKIGYSILRTIGKYKLNVDVNEIADNFLSAIKGIDQRIKCRLLIIDDVERVKMDIAEFFGYFSSIIEEGVRIVFIANENEIKCENYILYKEKIIGETYEISPNYENSINTFVEQLNLPHKENTKSFLIEANKKINNKNLRSIKQMLYQWNILINRLSDTYRNNDELLEQLFNTYAILQIQCKDHKFFCDDTHKSIYDIEDEFQARKMVQEQCQKTWIAFKLYGKSVKKYDESNKQDTTMDKVAFPLILAGAWYDILILGKDVDSNWVNAKIDEWNDRRNENKKIEKEIHTSLEDMSIVAFGSMDNLAIDIQKTFGEMCKDFSTGKYVLFDECMRFIQIYLKLISDEFIPTEECSPKLLKEILDAFIITHGKEVHFNEYFEPGQPCPKVYDDNIQTCIEKLFELSMENYLSDQKNVFRNKERFFQLIQDSSNALNKYLDTPIMKQMNIDMLFRWIESENNMEHHKQLFQFLKVRYGYEIQNRHFQMSDYPDYDNVVCLRNKYKDRCDELRGKYDVKLRDYKDLISQYDSLIQYLKNEMNFNKTSTKKDFNES